MYSLIDIKIRLHLEQYEQRTEQQDTITIKLCPSEKLERYKVNLQIVLPKLNVLNYANLEEQNVLFMKDCLKYQCS